LVLPASILPALAVGVAVDALVAGLLVVTFEVDELEVAVLDAGRAVVAVEGLVAVVGLLVVVVGLLVVVVEVAGRAVVLLLDEAGRAVEVAGRLVVVEVGRFAEALLC
jgi:hypothetical protein